jgi:hypothetical protein
LKQILLKKGINFAALNILTMAVNSLFQEKDESKGAENTWTLLDKK